jgi:hypothetical protein
MKKVKMTEKELAARIQKQRGSVANWGKKSVPVEPHSQAGVVFSVRFSPAELERIRERAGARGTTVSALIRSAVLDESSRIGTSIFWQPKKNTQIAITGNPPTAKAQFKVSFFPPDLHSPWPMHETFVEREKTRGSKLMQTRSISTAQSS